MSSALVNKVNLKRLLRIGISVTLLAYLGSRVDLSSVLDRLGELRLGFLPIAVLILVLQTALSAWKWRIILLSHGTSAPYGLLLRNYFVASFVSLFLPTSFGGDIYRVFSLKAHVEDKAHMTSSVLFDRLSGLAALVAISVVAYYVAFNTGAGGLYLVGYIGLIGGFFLATSRGVQSLLGDVENSFVRFGGRIAEALHSYSRRPAVLAKVMVISFIFQMNIVFIVKIYCISVGVDLPLQTLAVYVPLIFLTEILPISINGLGVREGAFVFFFTESGISAEAAASVALVLIGVRYSVYLVIGGGLFALGVGAVKETTSRMSLLRRR